MPRGDQFARQWRIELLLGGRSGQTVPDLMREVGESRRTIWRDLEVLQTVGFPITAERDGRESRFRLLETLSCPRLAQVGSTLGATRPWHVSHKFNKCGASPRKGGLWVVGYDRPAGMQDC